MPHQMEESIAKQMYSPEQLDGVVDLIHRIKVADTVASRPQHTNTHWQN